MGRIITLICFIVLVVAGVWWWHNYHSGTVYDGSVVRRDAAMEIGTTTMENGQNLGEAHPTPSRSDAPGTINGDRVDANASRYDLGTQTTPITVDPYRTPGTTEPLSQTTDPRAPKSSGGPRISYDAARPTYIAPPPTDSQVPFAPDGQRLSGEGVFQWYRQDNLTYRVDTRSGRSCIIYATAEEWRKPSVYRNGCRGR